MGPEPTPSERTWGVRPPPRRRMAFSTSEQIRTDDETIPTNTRRENTAPHWTLQQARPLEGELRSASTRPGQGPLEGEAYNGPAQARPSEGEKPQPPLDPRRQGPLARDTANLHWTLQQARATRSAQPPLDPSKGHSKARLYRTTGMDYFSTADLLWHLRWSRRVFIITPPLDTSG